MKSTHFLRIVALSILTAAINAHGTTPKAPIIEDGKPGEAIPVSWNPGHYIAYGLSTDAPGGVPGMTPFHVQALQGYLKSPWCRGDGASVITGIMIKVHWRNIQFDRMSDAPNYKIIDDWYEAAKNECGGNKRLIVMFKTEAENQFYGPAYDPKVHGPSSGRVQANIGRRACAPQELWDRGDVVEDAGVGASGHCMAAVWREPVMADLKQTLTALGRYLNDKPLIEGIFYEGEGAKGWVGRAPDAKGFTQGGIVRAYKEAMLALRAAAPNKMVGMGTSYFNRTAGWEDEVLATCQNTMGCSFVWPNSFSNDISAGTLFPHTDAHRYYCENSGVLGLFGGQEAPDGRKKHAVPVSPRYHDDAIEGVMDHCCYREGHPVDTIGVADGYCATHPWWRPTAGNHDARLSDDAIIRKLKAKGSPVYSTECPSNITRLGGTCVTGQT